MPSSFLYFGVGTSTCERGASGTHACPSPRHYDVCTVYPQVDWTRSFVAFSPLFLNIFSQASRTSSILCYSDIYLLITNLIPAFSGRISSAVTFIVKFSSACQCHYNRAIYYIVSFCLSILQPWRLLCSLFTIVGIYCMFSSGCPHSILVELIRLAHMI